MIYIYLSLSFLVNFFIAKRLKLGSELFRQQALHGHRRSRGGFLGGHQGGSQDFTIGSVDKGWEKGSNRFWKSPIKIDQRFTGTDTGGFPGPRPEFLARVRRLLCRNTGLQAGSDPFASGCDVGNRLLRLQVGWWFAKSELEKPAFFPWKSWQIALFEYQN